MSLSFQSLEPRVCALALCLIVAAAPLAHAQAFTCAIAEKPVCLKPGESIARAGTVCFEAAQCGAQGFVCASAMARCTENYQGLLRDFSNLSTRHDAMLQDADTLEDRARDVQGELDAITACVEDARTLRAAQACVY